MTGTPAVLIVLLAGFCQAQTGFEVATVKRAGASTPPVPAIRFPAGRFEARYVTLRQLIASAYQLTWDAPQEISGGPAWTKAERFDISAKIDGNPGQYPAMMQQLLADRFQLRVHRATRELPVYPLEVARGGPKLQPGSEDAPSPDPTSPNTRPVPTSRIDLRGPGFLVGHRATPGMLAKTLSTQPDIAGRLVIDKTGLKAGYDFTLKWASIEGPQDLPQLFTALQEQLGLRLESSQAPIEILIIDHAEMPSEN
ncbi:MAG TPA: TIGR03435 family protein [Bryobacteraceae bacterium]|nr:TIGR03435 family protein [Bryobacteraceae bacterium]